MSTAPPAYGQHIIGLLKVVLEGYISFILFIPKLVWKVNCNWNPTVILFLYCTKHLYHWSNATMHQLCSLISLQSNSEQKTKLKWLDPSDRDGKKVVIASFPRSGNSLMRGLIEEITGVYTGCDTRPDRTLSKALQEAGMKGEGIVDDSVRFVKTHYPERFGWKKFQASRGILVVRNPWDAINSYFNMMLTNTHNVSLSDCQYERFAQRWDGLMRNEIEVWKSFHKFWLAQPIPLIVVRYENLLLHREETLRRVFQFLLDLDTLEGTEWEVRIKKVVESGKPVGPYTPRSGKIASSFRHYSKEQFDFILNSAHKSLRGFGYDPETQNFPNEIPLPLRQVKPGEDTEITINTGSSIRRTDDSYGRLFTFYRKNLLDPVIAADGSLLNMHEVEEARERHRKKQEQQKKEQQEQEQEQQQQQQQQQQELHEQKQPLQHQEQIQGQQQEHQEQEQQHQEQQEQNQEQQHQEQEQNQEQQHQEHHQEHQEQQHQEHQEQQKQQLEQQEQQKQHEQFSDSSMKSNEL